MKTSSSIHIRIEIGDPGSFKFLATPLRSKQIAAGIASQKKRGDHLPFFLLPLGSRFARRPSPRDDESSTVLFRVLDGIAGSKFQGVPQASGAGERNRDRRKGERRCRRERRQPRDGQRMRRRIEEAQSSQMRRSRLRQGVHQELPPQGSQEDPHR